MSKPNKTLQQVLEYILANEEDKAAELIHEYVVAKARTEYQNILENEEAVDEEIDRYSSMEDDITADSDEIEADSIGEDDEEFGGEEMDAEFGGDELDVDMDGGDEFAGDEMGDEFAGDEMDVETKVDDLEDELEDLRADFERMVAELEGGDGMEADDEVDMDVDGEFAGGDDFGGDEFSAESVEYDLDEAEEVDEEDLDEEDDALEEATKLQNLSKLQHKGKVGGLPGSEDDTSTAMRMGKPTSVGNGNTGPVRSTDGSEGKKDWAGNGKASKNATTDNINVDHKSSAVQHKKGAKMPDSADAGGSKAALIPKKTR